MPNLSLFAPPSPLAGPPGVSAAQEGRPFDFPAPMRYLTDARQQATPVVAVRP
ncbi:MAG: hypothetical protein ACUVXH_05670 [Anaerolineae bacterium]